MRRARSPQRIDHLWNRLPHELEGHTQLPELRLVFPVLDLPILRYRYGAYDTSRHRDMARRAAVGYLGHERAADPEDSAATVAKEDQPDLAEHRPAKYSGEAGRSRSRCFWAKYP